MNESQKLALRAACHHVERTMQYASDAVALMDMRTSTPGAFARRVKGLEISLKMALTAYAVCDTVETPTKGEASE